MTLCTCLFTGPRPAPRPAIPQSPSQPTPTTRRTRKKAKLRDPPSFLCPLSMSPSSGVVPHSRVKCSGHILERMNVQVPAALAAPTAATSTVMLTVTVCSPSFPLAARRPKLALAHRPRALPARRAQLWLASRLAASRDCKHPWTGRACCTVSYCTA